MLCGDVNTVGKLLRFFRSFRVGKLGFIYLAKPIDIMTTITLRYCSMFSDH